MGLLDILNGMQTGSGTQAQSGSPGAGGPSPIVMALLALVASNALGGSQQTGSTAGASGGGGLLGGLLGGGGGGLGGMLAGGLGSLLSGGSAAGGSAGASAGGALSGGLGNLVQQFEQAGQGDTLKSWIGSGQNQAIAPEALETVLGSDKINALMTQSGLSRDDLLAGLSQHLPTLVNHLTPDGRVPTPEEASANV
jgi:uncharacterized protein YidB (DUF937 family)